MFQKLVSFFQPTSTYKHNELAVAKTAIPSVNGHGVVSIGGVFWRANSVLGDIPENQRVRVVKRHLESLIVDVVPVEGVTSI